MRINVLEGALLSRKDHSSVAIEELDIEYPLYFWFLLFIVYLFLSLFVFLS